MAVTYVGASNAAAQAAGTTTTAGTASVTPTLPTGTAIGDRVFIVQSHSNTAGTTPTGWTDVFKNVVVGTGTRATGGGQRLLSVYYRDRDTAWAMPAVTLVSATQNTNVVGAIALRKDATDTWNAPTATATPGLYFPATPGTAYSATSPSWTVTTGAMTFSATALNDNVSSTIGTPATTGGIVLGTATERIDGGSSTGNTGRLVVGTASVTTGGTGTITRNATLSAASQGGTMFVQQAVTVPVPNPKAETFVETFDGSALPARWQDFYAASPRTVAGGQVSLPTNTAYWYLHTPNDPLDLTGSSFTWGLPGTGAGSYGAELLLVLAASGSPDTAAARLGFGVNATADNVNVEWAARQGGTVHASGTVAPAELRYLRVKESGGTLTWETSPDGTTWAQRATAAASIALGSLVPTINWGTWGANATYVLDGINEPTGPAPQQLTATLTDAAAIVDSANATLAAQRDLTDTAGITDSASTVLAAQRALTDAAAVTDSASTVLDASRQLADSAAITDSASWTLTRDQSVTVADAAAIVDSATTVLDAQRTLVDAVGIADTVTASLDAVRQLSDSAALTDSATTSLSVQRQAADSAAIADSATTQLAVSRALTDAAALTDSASWTKVNANEFTWGGRTWRKRVGTGLQPGPNNFGGTSANVAVEADGRLRLSIAQVGGVWTSAEVHDTSGSLGYGRYRWVYDIDAPGMDHKPVLGLFTYDDAEPTATSFREIDIETTKWNYAAEVSRQWYSVHPTSTIPGVFGEGGAEPIEQRTGDHGLTPAAPYTGEFVWQPGLVYFRTTDANGVVLGEHVVTDGVFAPGTENVRMNLWLVGGAAPTNGLPVHAYIRSFEHTPGVTYAPVKADQFRQTLDDWYGWGLHDGATVTGGALELPTPRGSSSLARTGSVLDLRESSAQVEVTSVPAPVGNGSQEASWFLRHDAGNRAGFIYAAGSLIGRVYQGGTQLPNTFAIPYSATAHRWWRISLAGSTLTFWTSPDGATWTSRGTQATTMTAPVLSTLRHQADSGSWDPAETTVGAPLRIATVGSPAAFDYARGLADSAAITDTATTQLAASRTTADSAAITDTASTQLDASRALADPVAITDSASAVLDAGRALVDTAALADSASWRIDRHATLVDNAGIGDSASTVLDAQRGHIDAAAATDAASWLLSGVGERAHADYAAVTDSADRVLTAVRSAADPVAVTDSASAALAMPRAAADDAAVTDSASWRIDRYVTMVDSAGITDSASTAAQVQRSHQDAVAITDSVTAEITAGAVQHDRTHADAAAITDAAIAWLDRYADHVDAAALTDAASWRIDRVVTLVDSAGITDSAVVDLRVGGVTVTDAAALTDSASWRIDRYVTLVDSVGITDTAGAARQMRVALVDSAGIADSASAVISVGRNITVRWSLVGYRKLTGVRVVRAGRIERDNGGT